MRTLIWDKYLLLVIIVLIGGFLRFYKLSEYPVQLNHDEMSQLYEAISIAETGKDVYGNRLPVVFPLFGVYAPGSYIYLTALSYKIFGEKEIIIRIPAAVMGTLTILSVYLFVNILFGSWKIASLSAFLIAIMPSEIFYSRKSFEYMVGHFFVFLGLSFLLVHIKKKGGKLWTLMGGVSLASAMYTYAAHAITVPLLILVYIIIFKNNFTQKKKYLLPIFVFILFVLPLLYLTFTNPDLRFRASTIFISKDPNLGSLIQNTKVDNWLLSNIGHIKTLIDYSFNRYLAQFDPLYLFGNGLDLTNQGYIGVGPLYYFQIPLLILGIIFLIYLPRFSKEKIFLLSLVILSFIPGSLTFESHSPHRSVMAFTLLGIISAFGLYWIIKLIYGSFKTKTIMLYLLFGSIGILIIANFIYFVHMYTVNYPYEKSQNMHYPFKEVALFAWSEYPNFDAIVFDPQFGDVAPEIGVGAHYYFAYFGKVPPATFQEEYHIGTKPREILFDKFSIREIYWPADRYLKNTLVIASPWSVPENDVEDKNRIIKRFNFYNGKLAFYAIKL